MKCLVCQKEYERSFNFCPYCGQRKPDEPYEPLRAEEEAISRLPEMEPEKPSVVWKATSQIGWIPMIAIAIAVLAVTGWVLAAVFIGTDKGGDEKKTEDVARTLIQNETDEDYDAIFDQIDYSEAPLLGILISEALGKRPTNILILKKGTDLRDAKETEDFAKSFFASTRDNLLRENVKSLDSRKLEVGENYLVAVFSFDKETPFPLMEINSKDGWKVDMAGLMAMMARGSTPKYVIEAVEALLSRPSEKNCDKAIAILEAAEGLKDKYELWLKPEAEILLESDVASDLVQGERLTDNFPELLAKAKELRAKASDSGVTTTPETEITIPERQTIYTLEGEGSGITQPFKITKGLVIFHLQYQGKYRFAVTLVNEAGQEIEQLVKTWGEFAGSNAVSAPAGNYTMNVVSSGPWTIGIEEPAPVSVPYPPVAFSGYGPQATGFFQTKGGPVTIAMNYEGSGSFVVTVMELGGSTVDLAANETGPFQGAHTVSLKSEVYYLLKIQTTGPWAIEVK